MQIASGRSLLILSFLLLLSLLPSCSRMPVTQVELMPAPEVYGDGLLNPLPQSSPLDGFPYNGILFATDRSPASEEDPQTYYRNERGNVVRLGLAEIQFGPKEFSWEFARKVSMLRSRTEKFPVSIKGVKEWGIMANSKPNWLNFDQIDEGKIPPDSTDRFVEAINAKLAISAKKHVYIYVHGYRVVYEHPILVSAELWHFLGYEGAFIAYAWPSTPSRWAYIADSDTSAGYARNFRLLLETIAEKTDATEIHIIGYSNGTRLVIRTMEQLALIHRDKSPEEIHQLLRLQNILFVGSDLDREVFGSYVSDGILNVSNHLYIYMSRYDRALGILQLLTRRQRLGQLWGGRGGELGPITSQGLRDYQDRLSIINVSDAEGSDVRNGHDYFRSSPWASSDVLMTMYYDLSPEQRGLVKEEELPVFSFPADYIPRLWQAIADVDPDFADELENFNKHSEKETEGSR